MTFEGHSKEETTPEPNGPELINGVLDSQTPKQFADLIKSEVSAKLLRLDASATEDSVRKILRPYEDMINHTSVNKFDALIKALMPLLKIKPNETKAEKNTKKHIETLT